MKPSTIVLAMLVLTGCAAPAAMDGGSDTHRPDTDGRDVTPPEGGFDAPMPMNDASGESTPPEDTLVDGESRTDTGAMDTAQRDAGFPDGSGRDSAPADTGDTGIADADLRDGTAADTGGGCPALSVTITRPTAGEAIETCTQSGMPVYYDFTATTTGAVTQVTFNWINPDGGVVPPPYVITSGPPFVARRQVGGVPPPGETETTLANAGGRNAIGGTWTVRADALDRCGRTATATTPFTLRLTSRMCPNP